MCPGLLEESVAMEGRGLKLISPQSDAASPKMLSLGSWFIQQFYSLVLRLTTNKACNKNANIFANEYFSYLMKTAQAFTEK